MSDDYDGNAALMVGNFAYAERNFARAKKFWEESAAKGNSHAQTSLGNLYFHGEGVSRDLNLAKEWFEKAVATGNHVAQCCLGYMYYKGEGVPRDLDVAEKLYEKAAAQGNQHALEKLREISWL